MSFDTRSLRLDMLFAGVTKNDKIIARIAQINEVVQIAKAETRYRELLTAKWNLRRTEAVLKAALIAQNKGKPKAIVAAVNAVMSKWPRDVQAATRQTINDIYRLARVAGWKKGTGQVTGALVYDGPKTEVKKAKGDKPKPSVSPAFDVKDTAAISAIINNNMFWIGEHYGEHIADTIAKVVSETMLEAGVSHIKAGELIQKALNKVLGEVKVPDGYNGTAKSYFEGVAANAATVARVYGQLRSFAQIGITKYVIVNPEDERTCPVCSLLSGKVFTVAQGAEQLKKEAAVKSPEELKLIHPWLSASAIRAIGDSTEDLAEAGLSLCPYHFRCRCTIDVDVSSFSYESLEVSDLF